MIFNVVEIQKILPHRYPFLLLDRVTQLEQGKYIEGYKNVSIPEPVFQGHFPNHPIYPGVVILEGMAQAGGILALKSSGLTDEEIKNKVIKKEFDTVVRMLQSKENFVVYLLKHGYITTEMTIDQVSGLLLSQPTSQRLKTFTDIVNSGLLVANLNRSDVDILIAAILGNNCDAKTQQSKEQITNTVIRLLEGNNSSSKVFFQSKTKDEVAEQEKIKAEVIEIIKVIQQVHFVDFDIVFEGNHWKLKEAASAS